MKLKLLISIILIISLISCNKEELELKNVMEKYFTSIEENKKQDAVEIFDKASIVYCKKVYEVAKTKNIERVKAYLLNANFPTNELEWIVRFYEKDGENFETFMQSVLALSLIHI